MPTAGASGRPLPQHLAFSAKSEPFWLWLAAAVLRPIRVRKPGALDALKLLQLAGLVWAYRRDLRHRGLFCVLALTVRCAADHARAEADRSLSAA